MNSKGRIAWVVPYPTKGSGGFRTIVNNAMALKTKGYICVFYFASTDPNRIESLHSLSENIAQWFGGSLDEYNFACNASKADSFDLCIATSWDTIQWANQLHAKTKAYFIQDYEPCFYEMGSNRINAEQSYAFDFQPITIGHWLARTMRDRYEKDAFITHFGVDHSVYHSLNLHRKRAVCGIFQPEKPRRLSKTLLEAAVILTTLDPDIEVYLYGSNAPLPKQYDRIHNLGIISVEECNNLYNSCMCGISLSSSNPSRIPFEMMASGLPVIEINRDNNYYDFPDNTVVLAEPNAPALASAVLRVIDSAELQRQLSRNGLCFTETISVSKEADDFVSACIDIMQHKNPNDAAFDKHAQIMLGEMNDTKLLYTEFKHQQARIVAEESTPIFISNDGIRVTLSSTYLNSHDEIQLAIWSKDGQEDLLWVTSKTQQDLLYFDIRLNKLADEEAVFNLHFYLRNHNEANVFLFGIRQLFSNNQAICQPLHRIVLSETSQYEIEYSNAPLEREQKNSEQTSDSIFYKLTNVIRHI